jgi:DNA-binding CsgD family transcriptional regulator
MAALPDLTVKFIADTAGFTEATQQMTRSVENARRSVESNLTGLQSSLANFARGFAGAFAVSAIINEIINFGKATVDWAAGLDAAARQVGVTTEQLQQFQYWAIQGGATTQQLESALGHLTQTLGQAALRNDQAVKKFADLGVAIRDVHGAVRPTADILTDVVARLAAIPDPATRAARGTALLGESYRALAPAINEGAAALQAARDAAPVLAAEWSHRADELMTTFTNMSRQLRADVGPAFIWLGELILNVIQTAASAAAELGRIWDAFANLIDAGSLTGQLTRAEAELVRYGTVASNAEAEVARLMAAGANPATIANIQAIATAMRQAEEGARNTRNDLAAAISVTQPTPGPPPTVGGAGTRGGVHADAAAAREAQRLEQERARLNDRQIAADNKTLESLDALLKATRDYHTALANLTDTRRRDAISQEEYVRLQGRAVEQYRNHALAAVQLTDAYKRQSEGAELLRDRVATLNTLLAAGAVTASEYANLMRRATAEASLGAEGWKNFVKASEGIASGITSGLETALTKAKTSWSRSMMLLK